MDFAELDEKAYPRGDPKLKHWATGLIFWVSVNVKAEDLTYLEARTIRATATVKANELGKFSVESVSRGGGGDELSESGRSAAS